jgi:hypothetical protein
MRLEGAITEILQEIERITRGLPEASWYGFGSYFNKQGAFGDIDILVVCSNNRDAATIRANTENICASWPLHLVIMTEDEQRETGFVAFERCVILPVTTAQ